MILLIKGSFLTSSWKNQVPDPGIISKSDYYLWEHSCSIEFISKYKAEVTYVESLDSELTLDASKFDKYLLLDAFNRALIFHTIMRLLFLQILSKQPILPNTQKTFIFLYCGTHSSIAQF